MKRVLVIDIGEVQGGIENFIYNVYKKINIKEFHVDFLIYNEHCAYEEEYLKAGSSIFRIIGRRKNPIGHYKQLKKFFCEHQEYDFVWIQTCSASNIVAHKMVKKYTKSVLVTHAHVTCAETRNFLHAKLTAIIHKGHQRTIRELTDVAFGCSSEAGKYLFGENFNKTFYVIKNGIDLEKYQFTKEQKAKKREELGIDKDDFVVGHVGRFSKVKNHVFIVKVFKELQKHKSNSKLLLIGTGEELDNVKSLVCNLGFEDKVIFLGERNDVPALMNIMDAFIFPSFNEGFGIAVIEAQAAGVSCFINETLPNTLDITELVHRYSLEDSYDNWANAILSKSNIRDDKSYASAILDAKFDITVTARQVEQILSDYVGIE